MRTPEQIEGPYFPVTFQGNEANILTDSGMDKNHVIEIHGTLHDDFQKPISHALVIIWQADTYGRYNHPDDSKFGSLDPHFHYWGTCITDNAGRYFFRTVKPGPYLDQDEFRPPHIHFRIQLNSETLLTTQMYFPNEALNQNDEHLQELEESLQHLLIAKADRKGSLLFNITAKI